MALTGLTAVYLNRENYSRFEHAHKTVQCRALFTPNDGTEAGEQLVFTLYREGGYQIAQTTVTLSGSHPKGQVVSFDLESDCTIEPKTGHIFNNARLGQYYVEVENVGGSTIISDNFWVLPITPDELRATRLFGMTLSAAEVLAPVAQPSTITGVRINIVSDFMTKGEHTLIWDATAKTLQLKSSLDMGQWTPDGGNPVTITPDQRIYVITDTTIVSGDEYLICDIDYFDLPDSDAQEVIFIDSDRISDEYLRFFIREAYGAVMRDLQVPLEPTWISSDWAEESEWHMHYDAVSFEKYQQGAGFMAIETPLRRLLYLDKFVGKLNDGSVIEVPDEWRVESYINGLIHLVPQNNATLLWFSRGIGMWWLERYGNVPMFWHYRALCGLPHMHEEFAVALEAISKCCAIELMVKAGSAYRAGFSSESVGRDGISASQSYTSSSMFGIYSADIEEYKKWRDSEYKRFKKSIRGVVATVF